MKVSNEINFNINKGCAGLAFRSKEPVFEPFAQSSELLSPEELDPSLTGTIVQTIIALPLFDEAGNSNGVIEILNSDQSVFTSTTTKAILQRFSKYISLLFYTNELLKVFHMQTIEHIRKP